MLYAGKLSAGKRTAGKLFRVAAVGGIVFYAGVLPDLSSRAFEMGLSPAFDTIIQRAASGFEVRTARMRYPLWSFQLKYELLRDDAISNELKPLLGFFNQQGGKATSFSFLNPADNTATNYQFGTGDGVTKTFQLARSFGGFVEPVTSLQSVNAVYVNGVQVTALFVSNTGLVSFTVAPAIGAVIAWTGIYYYRCRFLADAIQPGRLVRTIYDLPKLDFVGSTARKV